jgi:transposase InsO family protein
MRDAQSGHQEARAHRGGEPAPRITGDRSQRKRGAGLEYLHVWVDDHSRLAYTELQADERSANSTCFLIQSADWFGRHGVTINLVITDNSSGYRPHLFLTACHSLGAKPIKIKFYTPHTNGRVEDLSRPASENGPINKLTSPQPSGRLLSCPGFRLQPSQVACSPEQ